MILFFSIKEEFQSYHKQKYSSKAGYNHFGRSQDGSIGILVEKCKTQCFKYPYMSDDADDKEREKYSHPEYRDSYSPGQKPVLPFFIHLFEDIRIDHGIVKR